MCCTAAQFQPWAPAVWGGGGSVWPQCPSVSLSAPAAPRSAFYTLLWSVSAVRCQTPPASPATGTQAQEKGSVCIWKVKKKSLVHTRRRKIHLPWAWRSGPLLDPGPWSDLNCCFWSQGTAQVLFLLKKERFNVAWSTFEHTLSSLMSELRHACWFHAHDWSLWRKDSCRQVTEAVTVLSVLIMSI